MNKVAKIAIGALAAVGLVTVTWKVMDKVTGLRPYKDVIHQLAEEDYCAKQKKFDEQMGCYHTMEHIFALRFNDPAMGPEPISPTSQVGYPISRTVIGEMR